MSQLKLALGALVLSWWICPKAAKELIEQAAKQIRYYRKSNARAVKSHTKRAKAALHKLGIKLKRLPRCQWDST